MDNKFYLDKELRNATKFGYKGKIYELKSPKDIGEILISLGETSAIYKFMEANDNKQVVIGESYFKKEEKDSKIENMKVYKNNIKNAKKNLKLKITAGILTVAIAASALIGCSTREQKKEQPVTMENYQEMDFEQLLALLNEGVQRDSFELMDEVQDYFNNTAAPTIKVKADKGAQLYLNADEIKSLFIYANADTYSKETFYEIFGSTFDDAKATEDYTNSARVLNNYYLRATNPSGIAKLFTNGKNQELFASFEQLVLNYNKKPSNENKQKIVNKLDEIYFSGKIDSLKNTCPEAVSFIGTHMTAALELNGVLSKSFADKVVEANETVTCNTIKEYIKEIDEYTEARNLVVVTTEDKQEINLSDNQALYYISDAMDNKNIKVSSRDIAPIIKNGKLTNKVIKNKSALKKLNIKNTKYTKKQVSKKTAIKEFGKEEVKKAEQEADKMDPIITIDNKDYSIDDANKIEEITREAKQYGVNFTNDIYQEMYRNNGSFNSATYEAKLTNKANSYTGKYKEKYKVALWQGYREAVRLAKELYDSEKQFREEAEKEIIKEEEEIVTTDRYVPKDTTVENNNTSNNTNNNTNNDNNNTNNENSTTVKTETVTPSADNNYTYEEETIVDRVYSK